MHTMPKPLEGGTKTDPDKTFARKSSGLVRAASTTDASLVNLYVATFPIMVSFLLGIVLPFYLGANLYLAVLIGFALSMPILVTYAVASSVMRRSGGDYVFIGRLLHPALGFAANFAFVVFNTLFLTSAGYFFCLWCLSPLSRLLGVAFESSSLLTFADTLLKPFSILVVSEIFVIGFGLLFMLNPTRSILKVFRYTIPVSLVGLLAFAIALLINSPDALHSNFDTYIQDATGVENATAAAKESSGFALAPFAMGATLLAVTWPSFSLPYYLGSAYFAGEVRNARRAQLLAGPVTACVAVVGALLLIWLSLGRLGGDFLGSIASTDPAALGLGGNPTYMEVAAGSSGSTILGILIVVGFGSWLVPTVPMSLLIMTRCMFGWSMDRIAPDALAKVSPRTGAPYVAVGVVTLIAAVISYFWAYTDFFTVVVGAFAQIITLGIGCLAASLLPFKRKDLYETAPIRGYIGPIPKLTLIGVLGAIGATLIVINFARDPSSGVNPSAAPTMFWISLAMFPFGFVLYYVSAAIRRRQGVDVALAFKEIPPE